MLPSLDRLKALDTLSTLDAQLEEAQALCTHPARADMILRWLLKKLKTAHDARSHVRTWGLLGNAVRILPPAKVAKVLASLDFMDLVQTCVMESEAPKDLISSLSAVVSLLLDISNGPAGAAVKAVLSIEASKAAPLLGAWLAAVSKLAQRDSDAASLLSDQTLLEPAFRLWQSRKPALDENQMFAQVCLAQTTRLRLALSSGSSFPSTKRKRNVSSQSHALKLEDTLDSFIAKHIFLPSRTSFSSAQPTKKGGPVSGALPERRDDLRDLLASFKAAHSSPAGADSDASQLLSVPMLLDIALRCTPLTTPRERIQEKPWVEALFSALLDCIVTDAGTLRSPDALIAMLDVIGARASLSTYTLSRLAKAHTVYDSSDDSTSTWTLVAKIVELDPTVYIAVDAATELFDGLSATSMLFGQGDGIQYRSLEPVSDLAMKHQLKDGIIVPIMKAFAKDRNLSGFILQWEKQLQRDLSGVTWFVWHELKAAFAPLLEESVTKSDIVALVQRLHGVVKKPLDSNLFAAELTAAFEEVSSSITILDAVATGVRSDDLVDAVYDQFGGLFSDLLEPLNGPGVDGGMVSKLTGAIHIWTLLTTVFNLWFPVWAATQAESSGITARLENILGSALFQQAIKIADVSSTNVVPATTSGHPVQDATLFLLTLCNTFDQYGIDYSGRDLKRRDIVMSSVGTERPPLVLHPDLIAHVKNGVRDDAVRLWTTKKQPDATVITAAPDDTLFVRAVVESAVQQSQADILSDIVRQQVQHLASEAEAGSQKATVGQAMSPFEVLSCIPANSLTRSQRADVLDFLATHENSTNEEHHEFTHSRLRLMLHFMALPPPSAKLLNDTSLLWRLALDERDSELLRTASLPPSPPPCDAATIAYADQLTSQVVKYLVDHRSDTRNEAGVQKLAQETQQYMAMLSECTDLTRVLALVSMVKVVAKGLFTRSASDKSNMVGVLDTELVETYLLRLLTGLEDALAVKETADQSSTVHVLLDALNETPRALVDVSSLIRDEFLGRLGAVVEMIQTKLSERPALVSTAEKSLAIGAIKTACVLRTYGSSHPAVGIFSSASKLAVNVLQQGCGPVHHEEVIKAISAAFTSMTGAKKAQEIQTLLLQDGHASGSAQKLLRVAISSFEKADCEDPNLASQGTYHDVLVKTAAAADMATYRGAAECILTILREKPFLTNQYTIEYTLSTIKDLVRNSSAVGLVYLDACRIFTILLQQYRSRLKDRLHLVVPVLQSLLSRLFTSIKSNKRQKGILTARHAGVFTRVVQLLCNPPSARRQSKTDLIDDARLAQAHAGQYVQHLLHHYCSQILQGTLAEGVREALVPSLWSVIDAMEVHDTDSVKVLSAAMSNSERAVLRGIYDDYKSFGKWGGH